VIAPGIATALTAALVALLLVGERRADRRLRVVSKTLASLGFVLVPVLGGALGAGGDVARWMLAGLALGMAGDVLLLAPRAFLPGLVVFLLGHVAYVVAFAHLVHPALWAQDSMLAVIVPVAALAGAVLRWLWPHLGALRLPVVAYITVIATMLIGGVACARWAAISTEARLLIAGGAALFFASDLAVARDRFIEPGFVNRAWGLPAYYAGQLLLAWSIVPT
jgi:uncharacterized membrane protein YhhN